MKRQVVRGLTMSIAVVTIALATAVVSNAQRQLTANVPFDFVIGDKALPSGEYAVNRATSDGSVLTIQSADNKESAVRLTNSIQPKSDNSNARLVFHRYGSTYFVAEVWAGGDREGRQLLQSKREKAMQKEIGRIAQSRYETIELMATLR